ncbi:hypothetical protein PHYPO_G00003360 [Pangasianodon hypophthalmus]|uniref:Uncharacterized protein n=1 Tax=Pangasianodon hypophthalmus TaxID=310915 RepID=A0A5N5Q5P6_PANHP|nr:hypothetical protein PHYPO_G00003360 [Pangasianodon hypophthalmus]
MHSCVWNFCFGSRVLHVICGPTIVNSHITVFSDAVVLMFASYYCLNISYPAAQGATLEFLQRCLFKINPEKGSKVEKTTSKKLLAVNPKVLSLITKIADYEWRE